MTRPLLLDLFCGAGGAAMGYHRAGFDVIGIDIVSQPRFPFTFVQTDALEFAAAMRSGNLAAIHASPPCQDYSSAMRGLVKRSYPRLIDPVRSLLIDRGLPYVIENVPGSALPSQSTLDGDHGVELCGTMFRLRVWRHRLFETSMPIGPPRGCDHSRAPINPYNKETRRRWEAGTGIKTMKLFQQELGIDWMSTHEASESIPPAYTEYIGRQLLEEIRTGRRDD